MELKNTDKPIDYSDSMKILEKRVKDVFNGKKDENIALMFSSQRVLYSFTLNL